MNYGVTVMRFQAGTEDLITKHSQQTIPLAV